MWNYVATSMKPTRVLHSRVGNFTGPDDLNLIIAKSTCIEIYSISSVSPSEDWNVEALLDLAIYGTSTTLELCRPDGQETDLLIIHTERQQMCIFEWDRNTCELVTRESVELSFPGEDVIVGDKIRIIDPTCKVIGRYCYGRTFIVHPFGDLGGAYEKTLEMMTVLDIKFLYGCSNPTIVVLYENNGAHHVETFDVSSAGEDICAKGPWSWNYINMQAKLLVPVPPPLCGVLIIGQSDIAYCSADAVERVIIPSSEASFTTAYGRCAPDSFAYLLGDNRGMLSRVEITHQKGMVMGLKRKFLGETSIASTISYLGNAVVYIGSSYGDSQLIKINTEPDAEGGSYVEVLDMYDNLGPIDDFCMLNLERPDQSRIVTCSGAYKDGSLRVVHYGMDIHKLASVGQEGIIELWSLRSSTDDPYDTFLVASFVSETRVLMMNSENELKNTDIEGFCSKERTLFCHDAVHNQHVQVTSSSVRLVSSTTGELRAEWHAPSSDSRVNIATANATQVLLAIGGGYLVYLEIGKGTLTEVKCAHLEFQISCLDINPIGENSNQSHLAAVGMWTEISVRIFSLPGLDLITVEHLEGGVIPRSVLLCAFEGISYLLCGIGDGNLLKFMLHTSTCSLTNMKRVSLGKRPIELRTFSSKKTSRVFAACDQPTVIYSSNKKLFLGNVRLNVDLMCPFNAAAFPESCAIVNGDVLTVVTIDHKQKPHSRSIPLGQQAKRICQQEQSRTFAICSLKYEYNPEIATRCEVHFVHLLDDVTFEFISTYPLNSNEFNHSIISCSFSDDDNMYYCVGTGYEVPDISETNSETNPTKGRILVFSVEDKKLRLITEIETEIICCLKAFHGKLLAASIEQVQLYTWVLRGDGNHQLKLKCSHRGHNHISDLQTKGDIIFVGDLFGVSLLIYKHEENAIEEKACHVYANCNSAVEILDDDIYLSTGSDINLFNVWKNIEGATSEEPGCLEMVGEYNLGEFVNRFRPGPLSMCLQDSGMTQIPTVIFCTDNGVIGVIASLPHEQYVFLEVLQSNLRNVVKGVRRLKHKESKEWRFFDNEKKTQARNFLYGDLIESFLDLDSRKMNEISNRMGVTVEELCKRVEELTMLH